MAKSPTRGLPASFGLDLPDDMPVSIGDFLDEAPPPIPPPRRQTATLTNQTFRPEVMQTAPVAAKPKPHQVVRCQLNLTPKSKVMLEEVVKHVQTYSPEGDTRTSEVFQAIVGLIHGAMDELELSTLPRRGAWGSVTAKNFPGALSDAFEKAIIEAGRKRGVG